MRRRSPLGPPPRATAWIQRERAAGARLESARSERTPCRPSRPAVFDGVNACCDGELGEDWDRPHTKAAAADAVPVETKLPARVNDCGYHDGGGRRQIHLITQTPVAAGQRRG